LLDRNDLRQLAQRITGRYHLKPLSREETEGYVRHRLRVAGAVGEIFTPSALREVYRLAAGIPRVINVTCDRALLGAYTQEQRRVTARLVRRAAGEVYGRHFMPLWLGWTAATVLILGAVASALLGWRAWQGRTAALEAAAAAPPPAVTVAAPAPVTVPPPVSIDGLLAANSAGTSDTAAFRRLLSLWGTAMTDDRDPCGQAQKAGLACLEQRGSWAQVRTLNRPAILTLTDSTGQRHRVVLSALDDQNATLMLGEHNQRVALDELARDWFGDFTVVWKPKTAHTRPCRWGCAAMRFAGCGAA
jgi:general secretion pathway protein A